MVKLVFLRCTKSTLNGVNNPVCSIWTFN